MPNRITLSAYYLEVFFCFQRLNVNNLTLYILRRKETCTSFSFCFLNTNWKIEEQYSVSRKRGKSMVHQWKDQPLQCIKCKVWLSLRHILYQNKTCFLSSVKIVRVKNKILWNRKFYNSCMKNNKANWCCIMIQSKDSVVHLEFNLENWSI